MTEEKKILVIQTAYPGDAILTLPMIQQLKKRKPDYSIDVLCIPSTKEIFEASPFVSSVICLDKRGKHKSIFALLGFIKELRKKKYDLIYSPHRSLRSALITMNLGSKESYGFENSTLKFAYKHTVPYESSAHEVKRNLSFVEDDFSGDKWRIIPDVVSTGEQLEKVHRFVSENNITRFISIAPGSVWATKRYPVEQFRDVINHFVQSNYQVVLMGGSDDKELCNSLIPINNKNVFVTAGEFSYIETIEMLRKTSLLICNDSAPTHMGMSADIPVLTIYCSTSFQFGFYPYNNKSDYVSFDNLFCKPCGIHGFNECPLNHFDCAKLLTPKLVIEKAERLLNALQ